MQLYAAAVENYCCDAHVIVLAEWVTSNLTIVVGLSKLTLACFVGVSSRCLHVCVFSADRLHDFQTN